MPDHIDADIAIVGGSIAGLSLVAMLQQHSSLSCVLIDGGGNCRSDANIPVNVLALTLASRSILQSVSAWQNIATDDIGCFRHMYVWDEYGGGKVHFDSANVHQPAMGYIIAQSVLEQTLRELCSNNQQCHWLQSVAAESLEIASDHVVVGLDDGRQVIARLLVAADGHRSAVRNLAGIDFNIRDYCQYALTCVAHVERHHQQVARQRFMNDGPLAFLPMADPHQCGVVWSTTQQHAEHLKVLDENTFNQVLAAAFDHHAGAVINSGRRAVFALSAVQAAEYCRPRVVLVGDAAHRLHPLAGQGGNLSLLDTASLVDIIVQAEGTGRDIGSLSILRKYARWRRAENSPIIIAIEALKYLFENNVPGVACMRNVGMNVFDTAPLLKEIVMQYAMGLAGDLPTMARQQYG